MADGGGGYGGSPGTGRWKGDRAGAGLVTAKIRIFYLLAKGRGAFFLCFFLKRGLVSM